MHHPYDSFATSVERFVEQAVDDPDVLAIKQTLYRTSDDSPLVPALIRAAERGKQAVVPRRAQGALRRAREHPWARALEEAGVHVVYGLPALKTHAKCVLVVRREGDGVRHYVHIGTGNYHPTTARLYTDFGLFTCRRADRRRRRRHVQLPHRLRAAARYRKVLVAPNHMRDGHPRARSSATIAAHASGEHGADRDEDELAGRPARASSALYRASQAGVQVDLNVRGICCLRPGVPGVSENIRVVSIVGRFLEHSRDLRLRARRRAPTVYIGSADLMPRNLDTPRRAARAGRATRRCAASCSTRSSAASPTTPTPGSSTTTAAGSAARRRARSPATCSAS